MANENTTPVAEDSKVDNSSQATSETTDTKQTSSPSDAQEDKGLEDELSRTKLAYSESSREAKRLAAELKETKGAFETSQGQVDELNEYIDILESKNEEEESEKKEEEPEKKPVRPEIKSTPVIEKFDFDKHWKEKYEEEKNLETEANKRLEEAKAKYPGMTMKSYRHRVSDKMKSEPTLNILDACQKVEEDIELERTETEGGEPFVESGSGAKGSQPPTNEDQIVDHLRSDEGQGGGLEGI